MADLYILLKQRIREKGKEEKEEKRKEGERKKRREKKRLGEEKEEKKKKAKLRISIPHQLCSLLFYRWRIHHIKALMLE